MPKLTKTDLRYDRFAREYVINQNGLRSAIAAGYSRKWAHVAASQLLNKPKVQELIAKYARRTAQKLEISAERVLNEIARIAFLDPRKLHDVDGSLIPVTELDPNVAAALTGIEVVEHFDTIGRAKKKRLVRTVTTNVKFASKIQALQALGNYLKLFGDFNPNEADPLTELIAAMNRSYEQIIAQNEQKTVTAATQPQLPLSRPATDEIVDFPPA
jgi:phage terminase small subunit